ncbi:hypothetical protein F4859DRAFT_474224 [Xylaria cf. heliscus]|nr:hypothetical protein F4859DRAFT_474224 [Xylaria cf. heliscus]
MADARALLRAHRAENRIKHPHAAYSDAGKLLCKLCHDAVKTESLWDTHIRSQIHRQRLQALQKQSSPPIQSVDESTNKRKRDEDADETMSDGDEDPDTIRTKRSKTDAAVGHVATSNGTNITGSAAEGNKEKDKEKTQTPPGLARRTSGTPVQGVEIAIPSRPATPLAGSNSTVSTPKAASMGRAALVGLDASSTPGASAAFLSQHKATASIPISNETLPTPTHNTMQAPPISNNTSTTAQTSSGAVDQAEWAAFEAEMAVLDAPAPPTTTNVYADATISAPALTTAQVAAKSQEEENERRKQAAEAEIADEREDATRALEDEFDEMAELEGRVRRLKERREELRKERVVNLRATGDAGTAPKTAAGPRAGGKENVQADDDDDEDEEDEDDEWDGFRFRV